MICHFRFAVSAGLLLGCLFSSNVFADFEGLHIEFDFSLKDSVEIPVLIWVSETKKIRKYRSDQPTQVAEGVRVYHVELLDGVGNILDSADLRLSSRPSTVADAPGLKGPIPTRSEVTFPRQKGMSIIRVTKDGKKLFEQKIVEIHAKQEVSLLVRRDSIGIINIAKALATNPFSSGNEREFFDVLLRLSQDCSKLSEEQQAACALLNRRVTAILKNAY